MIAFELTIIVSFLAPLALALQSPLSSTSSPSIPPNDLLEDLRKISEQITGDPENLEKLTQQLKQLSANNRDLAKMIESQMSTSKPVPESDRMRPESSQPGANPLVALQSRLNAFYETMSQLFSNMRKMFEQIPVPDNAGINPLKAIQSMEQQFQNMFNRLRINNPLIGSQVVDQETVVNNGDNTVNSDKKFDKQF